MSAVLGFRVSGLGFRKKESTLGVALGTLHSRLATSYEVLGGFP